PRVSDRADARDYICVGAPDRPRSSFAMPEQRRFFAIYGVLLELCRIMCNVVDHAHSEVLSAASENFGKNFADAVRNHLPIRECHVQPALHRGEIITPFRRLKWRAR